MRLCSFIRISKLAWASTKSFPPSHLESVFVVATSAIPQLVVQISEETEQRSRTPKRIWVVIVLGYLRQTTKDPSPCVDVCQVHDQSINKFAEANRSNDRDAGYFKFFLLFEYNSLPQPPLFPSLEVRLVLQIDHML